MYKKKEIRTLICGHCLKEYQNRYIKSRFCSNKCRHDYWNGVTKNSTIVTDEISRYTIGTIAEILVCADLMGRGYSVYKAISPNTFSDVIAIRDGIIYQLEVRTGRYGVTGRLNYPKMNTNGKSIVVYTFKDKKIHYITNPELS